MRKSLWIPILTLSAAIFLFLAVSVSIASPDRLILTSPTTCPSSGCAAGQRLNFNAEFTADPMYTSGPNTQICIYALKDGQFGSGNNPWADFSYGWIANNSGTYTQGETASVCSSNTNTEDIYISGAFASHAGPIINELPFALNISPSSDIDGYIKVKIFQVDASGSAWSVTNNFTKDITVAVINSTVYVGASTVDCGAFSPCFINSGDDKVDGLGTGLRDAVMALQAGDEILILNDYPIKGEAVLIDKDLTISGNTGSMITYNGATCNSAMIKFEKGGTIRDLSINDGNCPAGSSRTLIEVDSPDDLSIEHNTLASGDHAVYIHDNTGFITIAFNHIHNNQDDAVYRTSGTIGSGQLSLYANNILENGGDFQVFCNALGHVNHNFWGDDESPVDNVSNCTLSNGKHLGAPVQLSDSSAGVEALRKKVTGTLTYSFNNKIGVRHNSSSANFDVIIVNHGQGNESNIPFFQSGTEAIQACSNFFDVFLAEDAATSNLELALKYDLNSNCITTIESEDYCLNADSDQFPLWWYDPANNVTDGWDRTGQSPTGVGAGGATGQTTTCNITSNEILVNIDNTGRPGISSDLNFTPFIAGLPISDGAVVSQFTASFDINEVDLQWITTSENNVRGFYVLRSDTESGTYSRISSEVKAIGDTFIGGIYLFTDTDITFDRDYFYKIQVINEQGETIATHGPALVLTSTATPTVTLTRTTYPTVTPYPSRTPYPTGTSYPSRTPYPSRTLYPIPTATRYFYRSPTPYYRPRTSTPSGNPTQARTLGPSPTRSQTLSTLSPIDLTEPAYPVDENEPFATSGYPIEENEDKHLAANTPAPIGEINDDISNTDMDQANQNPTGPNDGESPQEPQPIRWFYMLIGAAGSLFLLIFSSIIFSKSYFK